jgi:ABC-type sugar transport system ATPase subunit
VAAITLDRVSKTFPGGHTGVHPTDLDVADGELLVLVGPSGCGKSTLLRLIAGLEAPTGGRVLIDGRDVTRVEPQLRDVAMVFQSYALYPHMSVYDNLAYGLRMRRLDRAAIDLKIASTAAALGLEALLGRRPAQLSGGQRQRVALGRALVREPKAFLLDEPLSNLDPGLRAQARAELLRLQRRLRATMVYVTHDQEEAMTLGTRVAVLREGRIAQVAPPLELYGRPADTFVASFVGSPRINIVPAAILGVKAAEGTTIGLRPHDVLIGTGPLAATVDVVEPRGHDTVVHLRLTGPQLTGQQLTGPPDVWLLALVNGEPPVAGSTVRLHWRTERLLVFERDGRRRAE